MRKLSIILLLGLCICCKHYSVSNASHKLSSAGDYLKVSYTEKADSVVFKMFDAIELPLTKYGDNQFSGEIKIAGLDSAIFSYVFEAFEMGKDSFENLNPVRHPLDGLSIWIGSKCDASYAESDELAGELIQNTIYSNSLEEDRDITIYTPKEFKDDTPMIYFADGQMVKQYAPYVDNLISENLIRPIMLVGVHSGGYRSSEYIYQVEKEDRFGLHADFFLKEVAEKIEQDLENWSGDKYLYGVSNGAAFCLYASMIEPKLYKSIIVSSGVGGLYDLYKHIKPKEQSSPSYYMTAGRYDDLSFKQTKFFAEILKKNNYKVKFKELISGHDYNAWRIEFLVYLEEKFAYNPS